MTPDQVLELGIIPLREKIGNYDYPDNAPAGTADYTTTRENWELRLLQLAGNGIHYYTTTRENWELRRP